MKRNSFIRLAALLLVPSLIANPDLATGASKCLTFAVRNNQTAQAFNSNALAPQPAISERVIFGTGEYAGFGLRSLLGLARRHAQPASAFLAGLPIVVPMSSLKLPIFSELQSIGLWMGKAYAHSLTLHSALLAAGIAAVGILGLFAFRRQRWVRLKVMIPLVVAVTFMTVASTRVLPRFMQQWQLQADMTETEDVLEKHEEIAQWPLGREILERAAQNQAYLDPEFLFFSWRGIIDEPFFPTILEKSVLQDPIMWAQALGHGVPGRSIPFSDIPKIEEMLKQSSSEGIKKFLEILDSDHSGKYALMALLDDIMTNHLSLDQAAAIASNNQTYLEHLTKICLKPVPAK